MTGRVRLTQLYEQVEAGQDPESALLEYSGGWLYATEYQQRAQSGPASPSEFRMRILGSLNDKLFVQVNGQAEAFAPQDGMTLTDLVRKVSEWMIFDEKHAYEWLQRVATKVSETANPNGKGGPVEETTTTAFVATPLVFPMSPKNMVVNPPLVHQEGLHYVVTSGDSEDRHVHEAVLDDKGDGITGMTGSSLPHAHIVDRYVVREFVSADRKFRSSHPGGIDQPEKKGD